MPSVAVCRPGSGPATVETVSDRRHRTASGRRSGPTRSSSGAGPRAVRSGDAAPPVGPAWSSSAAPPACSTRPARAGPRCCPLERPSTRGRVTSSRRPTGPSGSFGSPARCRRSRHPRCGPGPQGRGTDRQRPAGLLTAALDRAPVGLRRADDLAPGLPPALLGPAATGPDERHGRRSTEAWLRGCSPVDPDRHRPKGMGHGSDRTAPGPGPCVELLSSACPS